MARFDENEHPREPKGSADGVGGRFTDKDTAGDDHDLIPDGFLDKGEGHTRRWSEYLTWVNEHPDVLWMNDLLAASRPVCDEDGNVTADWRGEPVVTPEREVEMLRRATWRVIDGEIRYGPFMRALKRWFPSEPECMDVAERMAEDRLMALRRSCVADPSKSYSERLVGHALTRPVRMETLLAKPPYSMNPHQMRVGMRYKARLDGFRAEHGDRLPDARERDRIWDETMIDFVDGKLAAGKGFGRGMTLSDGHTADPRLKNQSKVRRDEDGRPYNGREHFERMWDRTRALLGQKREFDDIVEHHETQATPVAMGAAVSKTDDEMLHGAWRLARERGLDTGVLAERLGIDAETIAAWEAAEAA